MSLEKEFTYYKKNRAQLREQYLGKFIVIADNKVISSHNSIGDAYLKTIESGLKIGTFLIQEVKADDSDIEQTFHSRVFV